MNTGVHSEQFCFVSNAKKLKSKPIHALWWAERTSTVFTMILLMVWFIQSIGLSCFLSSSSEHQVPLSEVLIPIIASILLSVLHCHIAQTQAHEWVSPTFWVFSRNYQHFHSYIHFTKTQRRQRREQHSDHLRRSSIFSEIGPFAGIRARLYSKCSDTGTDEARSGVTFLRLNTFLEYVRFE